MLVTTVVVHAADAEKLKASLPARIFESPPQELALSYIGSFDFRSLGVPEEAHFELSWEETNDPETVADFLWHHLAPLSVATVELGGRRVQRTREAIQAAVGALVLPEGKH